MVSARYQCDAWCSGGGANHTINLGAGIDDALRVVGEAGQVHAIFLALELFCMLALFAVVDL
jgi:hypothetical protein